MILDHHPPYNYETCWCVYIIATHLFKQIAVKQQIGEWISPCLPKKQLPGKPSALFIRQ